MSPDLRIGDLLSSLTEPFDFLRTIEFSDGNDQPRVPEPVKVDRSCRAIGAANDPEVKAAAQTALESATRNNWEYGFYVSERLFGGYSVGPIFTSGNARGITRGAMNKMAPRSPILFVHTHQNNPPPSPVSPPDSNSAQARGIPYAAIDKAGNLTCTTN